MRRLARINNYYFALFFEELNTTVTDGVIVSAGA